MPRGMQEEDYRIELLIWILIGAFSPRGYIDPESLHTSAQRYKRELEKRGVEFTIYPDLITERSREVDSAAIAAIDSGILGWPDARSPRVAIIGNVEHFLKRPRHGDPCLSDEEIRLSKQAAGVTYDVWRRHCLDDDLQKDQISVTSK